MSTAIAGEPVTIGTTELAAELGVSTKVLRTSPLFEEGVHFTRPASLTAGARQYLRRRWNRDAVMQTLAQSQGSRPLPVVVGEVA
ncbi:hypothetical protein [Synechococcus sp. CBW1107]|uniref:hypothetical protein n=1 Tax=Synechococcus sp. CBW1107 TaxID=2789857 RepID=UPI002AD2F98C|nr:hypothetical protein [Synechococcus sp. CBW1107]CAK6701062.1 hypothetical protein IFHNHDMJ_02994 [Synechococcus sp. CBW1107]